jgi:xylulokinase
VSEGVTVGIDVGTTSVKAVAVDPDGVVVARARVPHALRSTTADELRHDAAKAWRAGPRKALKALGDVRPVALSVTGMVPSLAAVSPRGVPLSPGLLYGDASGRAGAASVGPEVGDGAGFLRALAAEFPSAHGYWPAQTTALAALGGPPVLASSVSLVLGSLAPGGAWDPEVLAKCGVQEQQLPRIVRDHQPVAEVDGVLLDPGAIDVVCERLMSGAGGPGDVLVMCGGTLITMAHVPPGHAAHPGLSVFPSGDGGGTAITASNAGGIFLDWVDQLVGPARGGTDPARVPVWSPYVRGERTPWEDPSRRGQLVDLHLGHDAAAVRRAAFEASAFVVRHHLELSGADARRVVAVGGGTRAAGWMQALADVTGLPVDVQAVPDGAAMGAAFLARVSAGLEGDLGAAARWARTGRRVEPDPRWAEAVEARYRRFRQLADRP